MIKRTTGAARTNTATQPQSSCGIRSSQSGRSVDELPRQIEPVRQMRGKGFHPECLRRIMPAEEKIDAELLRCDRGPMRRFARDEGVDAFPRDRINFGAGAAGYETDRLRFSRAGGKHFDGTA